MLRNLFSPLFFVLCSLCLGVSQPVVAAKAEPVAAVATAPASDRLNINSADAAAFQHGMVGIGEAKARAIVQYREENGPFSSVDDLLEVKGIGVKTLEKNRDRLSIE
ncbi:ComEA family DNA-binding protein [Metapseudomonas furukawaii]|uniref:ComEA family DNA-binding protein n=1 Tax=Metapseudomonas furukawaii TaxID=1149133 RepID=UPI0040467776